MASVGYTSGQRNSREIRWGANLQHAKNFTGLSERISCTFAHAWNKAHEFLPQEARDDYVEAIGRLGGLGMDAGTMGQGEAVLKYKIVQKGVEVEYETSSLAPPSGACARNYCRFVN